MTYWLGGAFGCSAPAQQSQLDQLLQNLNMIRAKRLAPAIEYHGAFLHTANSENSPSMVGLDRSSWPTMVVKASDGTTPHGLILFSDLSIQQSVHDPVKIDHSPFELDLSVIKLPAEDFSRVYENAAEIEIQIMKAMQGPEAERWSRANGLHAVMQPVKAAMDLAALPYRYLKRAAVNKNDKNQSLSLDEAAQ